ncbi:winged helix-turn-helix transcriptional regulator [Cupriavidus numazuensis]|nr:helix-turn-helix domain-containing protein [Cupriavidus numazuensis]
MKRKSHKDAPCPMARGIERIGDTWTMLILRDAFYGTTRFDEFQKRLGIAPNVLTRRLSKLIEEGLISRMQYSAHPPRDDYVLTERGRDFRPVLLTLLAWGNRHYSDDGEAIRLVERQSGRPVRVALVDADTGERITETDHYLAPGPAASPGLRARLECSAQAQPLKSTPFASTADAL